MRAGQQKHKEKPERKNAVPRYLVSEKRVRVTRSWHVLLELYEILFHVHVRGIPPSRLSFGLIKVFFCAVFFQCSALKNAETTTLYCVIILFTFFQNSCNSKPHNHRSGCRVLYHQFKKSECAPYIFAVKSSVRIHRKSFSRSWINLERRFGDTLSCDAAAE